MRRWFILLIIPALATWLVGFLSPAFGEWEIETADGSAGGGVGKGSSLCLDSQKNPQIAYQGPEYTTFRETYKDGGS